MTLFISCNRCARHLRVREIMCPFCAARVATTALSIGIAAAACKPADKATSDDAATRIATASSAAPSPSIAASAWPDDGGSLAALSFSDGGLRTQGAVYGGPPPSDTPGAAP